jgi:hypothetical protein
VSSAFVPQDYPAGGRAEGGERLAVFGHGGENWPGVRSRSVHVGLVSTNPLVLLEAAWRVATVSLRWPRMAVGHCAFPHILSDTIHAVGTGETGVNLYRTVKSDGNDKTGS